MSHESRLTRNERCILECLARDGGPVQSDTLVMMLWDRAADEPEWPNAAVRVHVSNLRKKIAPLGLMISSQPGIGYRLEVKDD